MDRVLKNETCLLVLYEREEFSMGGNKILSGEGVANVDSHIDADYDL